MDALIREFRVAYAANRGNDLAETLSPDVAAQPEKLAAIWSSGSSHSVEKDLKFMFKHDQSARLEMSRSEPEGWIEVYHCYWKAVGEILAAEGQKRDGAKVCWTSHFGLCLREGNVAGHCWRLGT
jgi:COP9 signalosome complex subunit 12